MSLLLLNESKEVVLIAGKLLRIVEEDVGSSRVLVTTTGCFNATEPEFR